MDLGISDKVKPIIEEVKHFIDIEIMPMETEYHTEIGKGDRWTYTERQTEILESLKSKAKAKNLWNFFLTHYEGGHGLNTVEYAYLAEETGRSHLAPEVFNCSAPDTGNMEVLARFCTGEQKETWLKPLLAGEIRSAYAMTEPAVASSDATNIAMSCVADGDEWVLNGQKTWTSSATNANMIFSLCRTDPDSSKHKGISFLLVSMDQPGIEVRPILDMANHEHVNEVFYQDARTAKGNVLGEVNGGWAVANTLLGFERGVGATTAALRFSEELQNFIDLARRYGKLDDPNVRQDIARFHTMFWPAMLQSAGLRTPTAIYAHGFLTVNGTKMSKSRGTFINASTYLEHLDAEYLRYYFAAKLSSGVDDIDLNLEDFTARVNSDVVGKVVNIASRCAGFISKQFDHQLSKEIDTPLIAEFVR